MAASGLIFHFMIAYAFTTFFFLVYPKIKILERNRFLSGISYGLFVWLIMNLIVVPISNTPAMPFRFSGVVTGITILMLAIGLPLSYIADRVYSKQ